MRFKPVFSIIGFMLVLCGFVMTIPAFYDWILESYNTAACFIFSAALTVSAGVIFLIATDHQQVPLKTKEMFLVTSLVWVFFTFFSALPYLFSPYNVSFAKAIFESASGLTTTGATIFPDLNILSKGTLLWRSLTHWMGGMGILVVAILILPTLRTGGMQLFNIESTGESNRDAPTVFQNVLGIIIYFLFLTVFCAICLKIAGMSTFDAINHAMSAMSTGGFSTHNESIAYFNNPTIEWVLILFLFIAGLPLVLGIYFFNQRFEPIKNNEQIKLYIAIFLVSVFLLSFLRWETTSFDNNSLSGILRSTAFSVISILSTTGFTTENYQSWGNFSLTFFMFLMACGACTGSTSGGLKVFRLSILFEVIRTKVKTLARPHGVFVARYGDKSITDDVVFGVLMFTALYIFSVVLGTFLLSLFDLDFVTSMSATITTLSGVGPGLGTIIAPDQTFSFLPSSVLSILSFFMILGRLEFVAILILFFPFFWKKNV